jgi:hypothetical protein
MLRILCVVENSAWVQSHIAGSLSAMGHDVATFCYGAAVGEFYGRSRRDDRHAKNQALLGAARSLRQGPGLDLIFCYVYDDFLEEETAAALRALDVPLVNYNVDMVNQWYRQTLTARYFTRMLCAQRANMAQLARYNPRVLHFPMAGKVVPATGNAAPSAAPDAPVTFVGTPMTYRVRVLDGLHRSGIPLAIYGKYWQEGREASAPATLEKILHDLRHYTAPKFRSEGLAGLFEALKRRVPKTRNTSERRLPANVCKGYAPEDGLAALFASSAINLGFTRMSGDDPDRPGITQVKLRDFEVPLAGGFYLVERVAEYEEFFRPGVEVECWETPAELIEKIRYYLDRPAARQQMASAAHKRAVAEHTWERRFSMLFGDLGLAT